MIYNVNGEFFFWLSDIGTFGPYATWDKANIRLKESVAYTDNAPVCHHPPMFQHIGDAIIER